MAELVDARDSKSCFLGSAGSIPAVGIFMFDRLWVMRMKQRPEAIDAGAREYELERYISEELPADNLSVMYMKCRVFILTAEGRI